MTQPPQIPDDGATICPATGRAGGRNVVIGLIGILILAAVLRLHGLSSQSVWLDEACTVQISAFPLGSMIDAIRNRELTPPLHYLLMHFWMRCFGHSEFAVRLPSVLIGVASVWMIFRFAARLSNTPRTGLIAAALLALSGYHIAYSQEARAYALMFFLALWSCDAFVRILRHPTKRVMIEYAVVSSLLLYTHVYAGFVLVAQNIAWVVWFVGALRSSERAAAFTPALRRWIALQGTILLLFLPWLKQMFDWTRNVASGFWIEPTTAGDVLRAYQAYAGSAVLLILLGGFTVLGTVRLRDWARRSLLLGILFVPVMLPIVISILEHRPVFIARYAIVAMAALYVGAGCGVATMACSHRKIIWTSVVLVAALIASLGSYVPRTSLPPVAGAIFGLPRERKSDWRGAGAYLNAAMRPGDFAAINARWEYVPYDYYVQRPDVPRYSFDGEAAPVGLPLPPGVHLWLILHNNTVPDDAILNRGRWHIVTERRFDDIAIYEVTDVTPASPPATVPAN